MLERQKNTKFEIIKVASVEFLNPASVEVKYIFLSKILNANSIRQK